MTNTYEAKHENIIQLVNGCKLIASKFQKVTFKHIDRKLNKFADKIAEDALVSAGFKRKKEKK